VRADDEAAPPASVVTPSAAAAPAPVAEPSPAKPAKAYSNWDEGSDEEEAEECVRVRALIACRAKRGAEARPGRRKEEAKKGEDGARVVFVAAVDPKTGKKKVRPPRARERCDDRS
jgi:hypothetical protein